jgi:hypothetical protein
VLHSTHSTTLLSLHIGGKNNPGPLYASIHPRYAIEQLGLVFVFQTHASTSLSILRYSGLRTPTLAFPINGFKFKPLVGSQEIYSILPIAPDNDPKKALRRYEVRGGRA